MGISATERKTKQQHKRQTAKRKSAVCLFFAESKKAAANAAAGLRSFQQKSSWVLQTALTPAFRAKRQPSESAMSRAASLLFNGCCWCMARRIALPHKTTSMPKRNKEKNIFSIIMAPFVISCLQADKYLQDQYTTLFVKYGILLQIYSAKYSRFRFCHVPEREG